MLKKTLLVPSVHPYAYVPTVSSIQKAFRWNLWPCTCGHFLSLSYTRLCWGHKKHCCMRKIEYIFSPKKWATPLNSCLCRQLELHLVSAGGWNSQALYNSAVCLSDASGISQSQKRIHTGRLSNRLWHTRRVYQSPGCLMLWKSMTTMLLLFNLYTWVRSLKGLFQPRKVLTPNQNI